MERERFIVFELIEIEALFLNIHQPFKQSLYLLFE